MDLLSQIESLSLRIASDISILKKEIDETKNGLPWGYYFEQINRIRAKKEKLDELFEFEQERKDELQVEDLKRQQYYEQEGL